MAAAKVRTRWRQLERAWAVLATACALATGIGCGSSSATKGSGGAGGRANGGFAGDGAAGEGGGAAPGGNGGVFAGGGLSGGGGAAGGGPGGGGSDGEAAGGAASGGRGAPGGAAGTSGPGGSGSGGACFGCSIAKTPIDANHLVYDSARQRLYLTIGAHALQSRNSLAIFDPASFTVSSTVPIGNDPDTLALSDDASTLWVGLDGDLALRQVAIGEAVPPLGPLRALPDTGGPVPRPLNAGDMLVLPGSRTSLVVTLLNPEVTPHYAGTYVFDDGQPRPQSVSVDPLVNRSEGLILGPAGFVFGVDLESYSPAVVELAVSPAGLAATTFSGLIAANPGILYGDRLVYVGGRLCASSGEVVDVSTPASPSRIGRFPFKGVLAARTASTLIMLSPNGDGDAPVLRVLDAATFKQTASVTLPADVLGSAGAWDLTYLGGDGVAFLVGHSVSGGVLFVIHAPAISPS